MMKLIDYCEGLSGTGGDAAMTLISQFEKGCSIPRQHYPNTGLEPEYYKKEHVSGRNRQSGAINGLAEKIFLRFHQTCIEDREYITKTFGLFPELFPEWPNQHMEYYLFVQAASYKFLEMGVCAMRASYASLFLAYHLPDAAITLVSNPKKCHFYVHLNEHIYDPLVNPEILFSRESYQSRIISKFRDSDPEKSSGKPFELKVTKATANRFNTHWASIKTAFILEINQQRKLTAKDLINDHYFVRVLHSNGIKKKMYYGTAQSALVAIRHLANMHAQHPPGMTAFGERMAIPSGAEPQSSSSGTFEAQSEEIITALQQLSKMPTVRLYKQNTQALITLGDIDEDQASQLTAQLSDLHVMKVTLTKLKNTTTQVIHCIEIDTVRLIALTPKAASPASATPSSSAEAGFAFRFD
ncbi:MAG: hypothetical protein ACHQUC_03910 [Chlamydiales bacterium]